MIPLWQTIVERLLSWPVVIFVLAFIFRKPIANFLETIVIFKFKGGGVEGEVSRRADQQIEAAARTPQDPLATSPIGQQLVLPLPEDIVKRRALVTQFGGNEPLILKEIEGLKADLQQLNFPLESPETAEVLIRHLAVTQLLQRAEILYRLIFGSQMAAMEKMNFYGPQEPGQITPFFEKARNRSPRFYADTNFELWIGFLINQRVVVHENGRYEITIYGHEFLKFVTIFGLPRKAH
jgi:hypothetical protein